MSGGRRGCDHNNSIGPAKPGASRPEIEINKTCNQQQSHEEEMQINYAIKHASLFVLHPLAVSHSITIRHCRKLQGDITAINWGISYIVRTGNGFILYKFLCQNAGGHYDTGLYHTNSNNKLPSYFRYVFKDNN